MTLCTSGPERQHRADVTFSDNQFLLDHCRCPRCFHPSTKQRLKTLSEVSSICAIKEIIKAQSDIVQFPANPNIEQLDIAGDEVTISWSGLDEAHTSIFPLSFLQKAAYDPPLESKPPST